MFLHDEALRRAKSPRCACLANVPGVGGELPSYSRTVVGEEANQFTPRVVGSREVARPKVSTMTSSHKC